ncbi:MAG: phage holin family protein [Verrucomicrobiota bacterium]|nr:phage holin family protein [Verrucomicrobiota bacterium]
MAFGQTTYDQPGLMAHLREMGAAFSQYFRARIELAGIESKEALGHYLKMAALLAGAAFLLLFGYAFLVLTLVFAIQLLLHVRWIWVLLGATIIHIGGALVCVLIAKAKFAMPVFKETLTEFKKDQEWLSSPK